MTASGCPSLLAEAIIKYRDAQGPFHRIEDLLKVPGVTKATYALLTGKEVTGSDLLGTLNELLGFPPEKEITLKDITDRINLWPDVIGCVLGQASGLPITGSVPDGLETSAIMAFAPKLLTEVNSSFKEFAGRETSELVIPTKDISYHIFRNGGLYMVILSRRRQLPRRYTKVARYVLSSIDSSQHQG
jgi:predicted regulator of Ras-like GTPase activity (Roadblock/LC7/MglB family)